MTVAPEMRRVEYGAARISYLLERRARTTLEISVEPDGTVRVVAPLMAVLDDIDARVRKRARWILARQSYFTQFTPRTPPRRYIPGETHLYLGRQYRLRVLPDEPRRVVMARGFIQICGVEFGDSATIERLVRAWYRERAAAQFARRIPLNRERFTHPEMYAPNSVRLQRMRTRWASTSPSGTLTLNPDLVRASADAIDYVITHELCHLEVPNHGREFYQLQESVMPDWEQRKQRLERQLA